MNSECNIHVALDCICTWKDCICLGFFESTIWACNPVSFVPVLAKPDAEAPKPGGCDDDGEPRKRGRNGRSARAKFRRRAAEAAERVRLDERTEEPEDPFVGQDGRPTASIPPSRPPD